MFSKSRVRTFAAVVVLGMIGCGGGGGGSSTPTTPIVTTPFLKTITLQAPSAKLVVGTTLQLAAGPVDQSGNFFSTTVTWSSSDNTVASVSTSGLVTAVANGVAAITATSGSVQNAVSVAVGTGGGSGEVNVTVQASEQKTFTPGIATIQTGGTIQFVFVGIAHTVSFLTAGSPASIPSSSGTTLARTFTSAGTFNYECQIHSGMTGIVIVR